MFIIWAKRINCFPINFRSRKQDKKILKTPPPPHPPFNTGNKRTGTKKEIQSIPFVQVQI